MNAKIEELNNLEKRLEKYKSLNIEIGYRLKILYGYSEKPTRLESIMHHIFKVFRKEKRYNFSQAEYFSCKILYDDLDFLKIIKTHVDLKIVKLQSEIDSFFIHDVEQVIK